MFRHSKLHWKADEICVAGVTPANVIETEAVVVLPVVVVIVAVTPPARVVELMVVTCATMFAKPTVLKVMR